VRGFYSDSKYQGAFETVGALAYRGTDIKGLREFARRLTFNLLIGNGDAHLKNWSLIYRDGRTAELSPAYDLVSTAPYMTGEVEDLGLKFGGSRRLDHPTWRDFLQLEKRLGAEGADLPAVVEDTVTRFEKEWAGTTFNNAGLANVSDWISSHFESTKGRMLE
jgi:serine/threonine-protein kinase HipA